MNAKEVLEIITTEDIINIMYELGSGTPRKVGDGYLFQSICHNGPGEGKYKLHYHEKSKTFFCYTHCGNLSNIFNLAMEVLDCSFVEAFKYVCDKLSLQISNTLKYGFDEDKVDNSFIRKFKIEEEERLEVIIRNPKVLNRYWDLYHHTWIKDHISVEVMKMFNIKFDISENRIIIPHYNIDGNLIGIRARHLDSHMIEAGRKYMPITIDEILYNYPTSMNLFGLNMNKDNIKKYKKIIIGESEKFVMQHRSFYDDSIAAALNGSSLSKFQIQTLRDLGVESVILALDKEFQNEKEEELYKAKINKSFVAKLQQYFTLEIIWDTENLLDFKDSPLDKGKEVWEKLYVKRIIL